MVSRDVPGQLRAGLPAGPVQSGGVVSAESSAGSIRAPAPDPGAGPCAAAVWVPPHLGHAAPGGMGRESQARPPTLSARRVAGPNARPAAPAHGPAPGPRTLPPRSPATVAHRPP